MKWYYGVWQNLYSLSWPARFLIELTIVSGIVCVVIWLLKMLGNRLHLKAPLVKGGIFIITELAFLVGRKSDWVVDIEQKMAEWGSRVIYARSKKKGRAWKTGLILLILVYLPAVFVDLPISQYLEGYYLTEVGKIKEFFQGWEYKISKGYEKYPPLFVKKEPKKEITKEKDTEETREAPMYLRLNKKGEDGSNIRREPSMDGEKLIVVKGDMEIVYQNRWERDGERYWLWVYVPSKDTEGWLSGNLIESEQLEMILSASDS